MNQPQVPCPSPKCSPGLLSLALSDIGRRILASTAGPAGNLFGLCSGIVTLVLDADLLDIVVHTTVGDGRGVSIVGVDSY